MTDKTKKENNLEKVVNVHGQKMDNNRSYSPNHYHNQNPKAAERAARRSENFYSI